MRKYLALLIVPVLFFVASCTDSTTDPVVEQTTGSVFLQSSPSNAIILLDGVDAQKETPDTLKNISSGDHQITLRYEGYYDSIFTVKVTANTVINWSPVNLRPKTAAYGPIKIWETTGTTASQPSGLILSTGTTASSSSAAIDLLYYSNSASVTYDLRSSDLITTTARKTRFKASGVKDVNDGATAPTYDAATWTNKIPDRDTTQYYFVYDNDTHYAKVKVVSFGDVSGQEAFVNVQVLYNKAAGEKRFK